MKASVKITGVKETFNALSLAEKQTNNVVRQSVHAAARFLAKDMKRDAPVLSEFEEVNKKGKTIRKKGVLKNAIKAIRRKPRDGQFISDAVITQGKNAKYDAWYWHFVAYGTIKSRAQDFVESNKAKARASYRAFLKSEFNDRVIKKLKRGVK